MVLVFFFSHEKNIEKQKSKSNKKARFFFIIILLRVTTICYSTDVTLYRFRSHVMQVVPEAGWTVPQCMQIQRVGWDRLAGNFR